MKKIILFMGFFMGFFLFLLMLMMVGTGGQATQPVIVFADQEKAEAYQYVGAELGVPWDIIMLADAIYADQENLGNINELNPLITSLEFCIIQEDVYNREVYEDEEGNEKERWVLEETNLFEAGDNILSYIGKTKDDITYNDANLLVADINDAAEKKAETDDVKYIATLVGNPEYEFVLKTYIKLEDDNIGGILELHAAKYLAYLYGFIEDDMIVGDVTLPDVTNGNISRHDLAKVAVSIINWPYLMGGKSSSKGLPSGPLDCSGFVDWVYVQCFGKGISSGGSLPSGVAIAGTAIQYYASREIPESELKVGDLGFSYNPALLAPGKVNHVGIYIGELNGQHLWIHCAGKSYGYEERPRGRVGISLSKGSNSQNPITGDTFAPPMKGCDFKLFRRPNFSFIDD